MFKKLQTKEALFGAGSLFLALGSLLLLLAFVGGIIMLAQANDKGLSNTITVTGTGEVEAVPDTAQFTFTARAEANTVAEAQSMVNIQVDAVLDALEDEGIADEDIKTTHRSSNERYEYNEKICLEGYCPPRGERELVGYEVSQNVQVKVRVLDSLDEVDAIFGASNLANYYGPNFTIDDPDELQVQAKEVAIEDAREEAERLADELGVRLGKLISYSSGGNNAQPMYRMAATASLDMAESAPGASYAPGQETISENVTLTYKIK